MDEKIIFCPFFMQSNGLYIRVIDERLFKTTKEVTALTRDIDYIVDKFSDDIYRAALAVTGSVSRGGGYSQRGHNKIFHKAG